jgi:NMD protein affecting ribosome stability and mRNA decay
MRAEVTGEVFRGRCEVRTEFCRACVSGAVAVVKTGDGGCVTVCGACLEEMADTGQWEIPGSRPEPPALFPEESVLVSAPPI